MRVKKQYNLGPDPLQTKVIPIGNWDMDATPSVSIAHGLTLANIRKVFVGIINDAGTAVYPICYAATLPNAEGCVYVDGTNVVMTRRGAGFFDHVDFDTAVYNRGFITVEYK